MGQATRHIAAAKKTIPGKTSALSVIIPAAGLGRRMKSTTKALTYIDNTQTIIERQIELIWNVFPKSDIFVVVGFQADQIRKKLQNFPIRFIYNPIYENTNVAFSLGLALQASIGENALIIYGDLIFNQDAISTITDGPSKLLVDANSYLNVDEVGLITDETKNVSNLSYGLPHKWAQIAYVEGDELELLRNACYDEVAIRWFGYEAFNQVINKGGTLSSHLVKTATVFDIDTPQELIKAKEFI